MLLISAQCDAGPALREGLTTLLPHIRVCTLSLEDFCRDIMPTRILTDLEMVEVCLYLSNKNYTPHVPEISSITQPRILSIKSSFSPELTMNIHGNDESYWAREYCFGISTRERGVQLCSIGLYEHNIPSLDCVVRIQQMICSDESQCLLIEHDSPVTLTALVQFPTYKIVFPVANDDGSGGIVLQPNCNYAVTLHSEVAFSVFYNNDNTSHISGDRFTVCLPEHNGYYTSCIQTIKYKTITP